MQKFVAVFFVTLTFGLAIPASAEQNQLGNIYTVKRRCDLKAAIAAGKYDRMSDYITLNTFPVPEGCVEGEEVEVRLFSPYELELDAVIATTTTQEVKTEIGKRNYRPVDWTFLLPLGEKYPDFQRKFWIVGLGSKWHQPGGDFYVPVLAGGDGERHIDMLSGGYLRRWVSRFRFAVRK